MRVYAPCPFVSKWTNQQLLKDCGLIPYMLYKIFGYDATMIGVRHGEYPYLEKYLNGMKMEFFPDCRDDVELLKHQLEYVYKKYREMDVLVLNGPYLIYQLLVPEYRKLRPDGKIYLGLDASSHWMDRIRWTTPEFSGLLTACDVIATSCRAMQRHLSKKWPRWKIEYVPNGFFNSNGHEIVVSPTSKENIILTVARIGIPEKANDILLEAFARIHAQIPDWKVHLVGSVDNRFRPYIEEYFQQYPQLRERVVFKGLIESKEELFDQYRRAKIFALTSKSEGGAPNVVAEALHHGCYMITSAIDAAPDITNNGALGRTFPIGDAGTLADILREVCSDDAMLRSLVPEILAYAKNIFDWELIIKRVHHLLFAD